MPAGPYLFVLQPARGICTHSAAPHHGSPITAPGRLPERLPLWGGKDRCPARQGLGTEAPDTGTDRVSKICGFFCCLRAGERVKTAVGGAHPSRRGPGDSVQAVAATSDSSLVLVTRCYRLSRRVSCPFVPDQRATAAPFRHGYHKVGIMRGGNRV